jgi:hypothetical protein
LNIKGECTTPTGKRIQQFFGKIRRENHTEYPGCNTRVNLKISSEKAILLLNEKADVIKTIIEKQQGLEYYDFVGLCSKILSVIHEIYGADDTHPEEIRIIGFPTCSCNSPTEVQIMLLEVYHSHLLDYIDEIRIFMKTPEQ